MNKELKYEIFVTIALLSFFGAMIVSAIGLHPLVRLFPLLVCIPMFLVALTQLLSTFNPRLRKFIEKLAIRSSSKNGKKGSGKSSIGLPDELTIFAWLIILPLLLWGLGILPSASIFLILFFKIASKQNWKVTFSVTFSFLCFLYLLFGVILDMTLFSDWLVQI